MKSLFLLLLIISSSALAFDPCSYPYTGDLLESLESQGIEAVKVSNNHKRFRFVEKQMVHLAVSLQDWLSGVSKNEALEIFAEDSSDGEIIYYQVDGKEIAYVHYWPGDNEYGAFFEMGNKAFKLLAEIRDSEIVCE